MTLEERLAEWPKQRLRQGREQGVEQGLAHERALLRRQVASRFGAETAAVGPRVPRGPALRDTGTHYVGDVPRAR